MLEVVAPPTHEERARVKRARLSRQPLLRGCSRRLLRRVAAVADTIDVPAGQVLVQQGHHGLWFFLVEEGRAEVIRDGQPVEELGRGQWFGEAAVLRHVSQPVTVRTLTDMTLFVIGCQRLVPLVRDTRALRLCLGDVTSPPRVPLADTAPWPAAVDPAALFRPAPSKRPVRRRRRGRWLGAAALVALGLSAAAVYHPPVAVVAPGPVVDAGRDVTITGVPTSPLHGRYLFPTVRTSRPTALGLGLALMRPHREVMALRGQGGPHTDSATQRAQGAAVFRRSRMQAAAAAASAAGLRVQVSKSGAVSLPFTIRFRERAVVGPSAGLAYALAIEDMLDPTDIGRGRTVAATGAIEPGGRVDAVGYVALKAAASRGSGAKLLLVPDGEATDAAGEYLATWSVTSLQEVLASLQRP